jgi:6-phosphofructokinase 1
VVISDANVKLRERLLAVAFRMPLRALVAVVITTASCSQKSTVTVYPVQGKVLYRGRPATGARVAFHPLGNTEPDRPLPQATVEADGSFHLSSSGKGDSMSGKPFNIGVMTAGGDCPGLNACIRAVVRWMTSEGGSVVGIPGGFRGLLTGETIPLDARSVAGIMHRGGTMLRTARLKEMKTEPVIRQAAGRLDSLGLDGLVVIGGNGSLHGAWDIARHARTPLVGVPKTIDNDVGGTDYAIGFDSAVNTAVQAIDKIRDTAISHDRVFVVEVMGRHHGYLALAVGMASAAEVVLVPEAPLAISEVARALRQGADRGKRSNIVVVAEGYEGGAAAVASRLTEEESGLEVRISVLGYIQRGGAPTAFDRLLATQLGQQAVEALRAGERTRMVGSVNGQIVVQDLAIAWEQVPPFRHDWLSLVHRLGGIW